MELKQRVANIFKFLSMAIVIGSLMFMYAYGSDAHSVTMPDQSWLSEVSKTTIFYTGLIIFGIVNIIFNWWFKMYRETDGFDARSFLFKSEYRKAELLVWFTVLMAVVNFFISTVITYIGFIKIDGIAAESKYFFIPLAGLAVLLLVIVSGTVLVLKKT
jgi:hypothetical protein